MTGLLIARNPQPAATPSAAPTEALGPLNLAAHGAPVPEDTRRAIAASLNPRDILNSETERVGADNPLAMFFKKIAGLGINDGQLKATGKLQMGEVLKPEKWGGDLTVETRGKPGEALSVSMPPEADKKIKSILIMDATGTEVLHTFERGSDGKFAFDRALTRGTRLFFETPDGDLVSKKDFVAAHPGVSVSNGHLDTPVSFNIPEALKAKLDRIHVVVPGADAPIDTITRSKDGEFRFHNCADRYPAGSRLVFELKDGKNVNAPLHPET